MRIVKAFGWIPIPVFKSKPPGDFRGYTKLLLVAIFPVGWIKIHPDFWDDEHILVHELQHVEDFLRNPFRYWRGYKFDEVERAFYESRAYARQYVSYPESERTVKKFNLFVALIHTKYNLTKYSPILIANILNYEISLLESGID